MTYSARSSDIHPLDDPFGAAHHTDYQPTPEDIALGRLLGRYLGDFLMGEIDSALLLPADIGSSVDLWTRVARALRSHGLKIVDRE